MAKYERPDYSFPLLVAIIAAACLIGYWMEYKYEKKKETITITIKDGKSDTTRVIEKAQSDDK